MTSMGAIGHPGLRNPYAPSAATTVLRERGKVDVAPLSSLHTVSSATCNYLRRRGPLSLRRAFIERVPEQSGKREQPQKRLPDWALWRAVRSRKGAPHLGQPCAGALRSRGAIGAAGAVGRLGCGSIRRRRSGSPTAATTNPKATEPIKKTR